MASEGKKGGETRFGKNETKFIWADEKIQIIYQENAGPTVCSSDNNTCRNINTIMYNIALQTKKETFLKQMKGMMMNHYQKRLKLYVN